ncbi:NADPH:quinone reductase [Rosistilla oblonga]|uniref:Quinone oxidoreductase 1 n=1 Tax=Rosistilla oblonga TaxID=2527990 RepID=A0A518IUZ4_9BACT|nr:NADPH:quinone reductase [Rosistilla oblonga]QDV56911.1 Quinone oxidoreductase 1 [Rosistilla oblonga]
MKAAFIKTTGDADVIQYGDLPDPQPGQGQVLVRTEAVSVNPIDTYVRSGMIAMDLPDPFIIGCDIAGTIAAVGEGVTGFRIGDRVWGSSQGLLGRQGTFAELCAIDQDWLYELPDGVAAEDAAACALVGITAHLGLFGRARLLADETIFVRGGTGGVGSMVVQMAKAAGANVITTGGSDEKVERCRELGADFAINYKTENLQERLAELAPDGLDVFWETIREPDFDFAVEALAPRGRMVLMAGRDARPEFPVGPFYVKECTVHGFVMFKASADEMKLAAEDINQWLASGQLKSQISQRLPLSQAAQSHRLQEAGTLAGDGSLAGKVVLTVGD